MATKFPPLCFSQLKVAGFFLLFHFCTLLLGVGKSSLLLRFADNLFFRYVCIFFFRWG